VKLQVASSADITTITTTAMVPPAVAGTDTRFVKQQAPFYGYVNPPAVMGMPPFAFNNPYINMNAAAVGFNQQNTLMGWGAPGPQGPHSHSHSQAAKDGRGNHAAAIKTNGGMGGVQKPAPTAPTPLLPLSEKEAKELKRKKANRESARRSKLRKKEEFESLAKQVDILSAEGMKLRTEIAKMEGVLETLSSQNQSLKQEVLSVYGHLKCIENIETQSPGHGKQEKKGNEGQSPSTSTVTSQGSDGTNQIQARPSKANKKEGESRLDSGCESDDGNNCTISLQTK